MEKGSRETARVAMGGGGERAEMNWKRGLFRTWIAASICWVILILVSTIVKNPGGVVVQFTVPGTAQYYACERSGQGKQNYNPFDCIAQGGAPNEVTRKRPYTLIEIGRIAGLCLLEMVRPLLLS